MQKSQNLLYDVIVIGGSFSGLSASLGLARALFKVLVIDSGEKCNKNVIEAHNFLTYDGAAPADLYAQAKEEVSKYKSVEWESRISSQFGTKKSKKITFLKIKKKKFEKFGNFFLVEKDQGKPPNEDLIMRNRKAPRKIYLLERYL